MRRPAAWLPIVLSLMALAMVLGYAAIFGIASSPEPHDEGAPARLFQLLMAAAAAAIVFFAVRWLPKAPIQTAAIIVLQVFVAAMPIAAIVLLES